MARCEVCGNEYDKAFEVVRQEERHTFDCFECAIHALAPSCEHCGCRIIGHGVEADGRIFCCQSCAGSQHPEGDGDEEDDARSENDDSDAEDAEDAGSDGSDDEDADDDGSDDDEEEEVPSEERLDRLGKRIQEARQSAEEDQVSADEDGDGEGAGDGDDSDSDGDGDGEGADDGESDGSNGDGGDSGSDGDADEDAPKPNGGG